MDGALKDSQHDMRPIIITVICFLGFVWVGLNFLSLTMPTVRAAVAHRYGTFTLILIPLGLGLLLVILAGYWRMREWAVWLSFLPAVGAGIRMLLNAFLWQTDVLPHGSYSSQGTPSDIMLIWETGIFSFANVIPIVITGIGLAYINRMR